MDTSMSEFSTSSSVGSIIPSTSYGGESRPTVLDQQLSCIVLDNPTWEGNAKMITTNNRLEGREEQVWRCCWSQVCYTKPKSEWKNFQMKNCVFPVQIGNAVFFVFNAQCWLCTNNFYICSCSVVFFMHSCLLVFQMDKKLGITGLNKGIIG